FEAFRATGLPLDHVNTHQHYHLHPWVTNEILAIGADYGMRALRVPAEPRALLAAVDPTWPPMLSGIIAPLAALMRGRAQAAGIIVADRVFGLAWSGAMTEKRVAGLIARLPEGCSEIYLHPAVAGGFRDAVPDYRYEEELAALLSPKTRGALQASGATLGGYADFVRTNKRNRASSRRVLV
ncbi:MAG: ChbG/HpnK family deacetylase, partial [Hyphomicrobiales bacterium]|nr:ChbG/HpnK family deacetylase [Hyphomicrobiales bacterium]